MTARLLYVMDPMCSWCWGFSPIAEALVEQAQAAGVELHLVVGGLRTGSGSALEPATRRYILEHWQAVTEATGQPFTFEGALPEGFVYDTEPACRAIVTARSLAPDCAWKLLWLHSDMHPRGKDLYDAMLLAEATTLPSPLLRAVFEIANSRLPPPEDLASLGDDFEWVGFQQQDQPTVDAWKQRLARALRSAPGD